jgi:large subunit ribosomal protein L30
VPEPKKPKKTKTAKRAPRARKAGGAEARKSLRVKQVKSGIGHAETYRRTLRALGLRHHQHEIAVADNPSVRGMLFKVRHLVRVSEEA